MNIFIKSSAIQFKNPTTGQPTRAVKEHYNGRRITVDIDGEDRMFRFKKEEMPFICDEDEMVELIERMVLAEQQNNDNVKM